jgi:hypothetical protein
MGEAYKVFEDFILSNSNSKPECFGEACNYCFQKQYCYDFIKNKDKKKLEISEYNFVVK